MGRRLFLTPFLMLLLIGFSSHAQNISIAKKFFSESNQKKVLSAKGKEAGATSPQITIHFYWASWCDYCEKAYSSLRELQKNPSIAGKIQVVGYCLDSTLNDQAKAKLTEMNAIDQYLLTPDVMKSVPEMGRLPAFIVENKKTNKLEAYTGFNVERFNYLRKDIARALKSESLNEE